MNARPFNSGSLSPANDVSSSIGSDDIQRRALSLNDVRDMIDPPARRFDRLTLGYVFQLTDLTVMAAILGSALMTFEAAFWPMLVFLASAGTSLRLLKNYRIRPRKPGWIYVTTSALSMLAATTITLATVQYASPGLMQFATQQSLIAGVSLIVLHTVYAFFIEYWARQGRLSANVVIVGATANARRLIEANSHSNSINILGIFDDRQMRSPSRLAGAPYLGTLDDLANWPKLHDVDRVIITVTPHAVSRVQMLLSRLSAIPQPICLLLDFEHFRPNKQSLDDLADTQAARLSGAQTSPGWIITKRLQDLVIGSIMFIAALPIMALLAAIIKLDSPGPVLFRQLREGFNGKPIEVLKFRSMRNDPPPDDGKVRQVERDDPRVTRIGKFIRKTSLDELPQLWNVLKGEMSLVGPRPHAPGMTTGGTQTSNLVAEYAHRHRVKPGLTGWAQVNGSRGPLHSPEAARERIRYDVEYIGRASLWFDLWIMLRTGPALLGDKINIR